MSCQGRVIQLLKGRSHARRSLGMAGLQANTHALRPMGPVHWHEDRQPAAICGHFWPLGSFDSHNMLDAVSIAERCSQIRECVSDFELMTLDCPLWLAHEPVLPYSGAACFLRVEPQSVLGYI